MKTLKGKISLISIATLALILTGQLSFAQEQEESKFKPVFAVVTSNQVNIRAGGGVNFEILGQANKNEEIVVLKEKYGWYKVKLPKQAQCFVHKDYIDAGWVKTNRLRVRAGAGENFNVLGVIKKGEFVNILSEEGNWLMITPPDNCVGWIKKEYLQLSKKEYIPQKITQLQQKPKPKQILTEISKAPILSPMLLPSQKEQKEIKAEGIIVDLGKIINRQGTHKLIKNNKVLYYLRSENINLNHFIYQNVAVIGKLFNLEVNTKAVGKEKPGSSAYPVINVEQIMKVK